MRRGVALASILSRRALVAAARARLGLTRRHTWRAVLAQEVRKACEELGPAFIKIGQLVSVRPDVFPPDLCLELAKLQDAVPPIPTSTVEAVLRDAFGSRWRRLFADLDPVPFASASVAQVHRANLAAPYRPVRGSLLPAGTTVAVKVVRPGIEKSVEADLAAARTIVHALSRFMPVRRMHIEALLEEFASTFRHEVDLRNEAFICERFGFDFRDDPVVLVPRVVWTHSARSVLTTEFIEGWNLLQVDEAIRHGVDVRQLARHGARVFMRQVLLHGRFHADLHPANLLVTEDQRIVYLDFGIVGTLSGKERRAVAQILAALVFRDAGRALEYSQELGLQVPPQEVAVLKREISALMDRTLSSSGPGPGRAARQSGRENARRANVTTDLRAFGLGLLRLFARHRVAVPPGYGLLIKALVTVEGVARMLYPDIDIMEEARPFVTRLLVDFEELLVWRKAMHV